MLHFYKSSSPRRLVFVYSKKFRYSGSTIMRGEQLSAIAKATIGDKYHIDFAPIKRSFNNSDLFITKGAIAELSPKQLNVWKRNSNRLFFDPVDGPVPNELVEFADTIVAASKTAYSAYKKSFPRKRIVLVNHHVDPRIVKPSRRFKDLRVGYFGELVNTIITPSISEIVHFVHVDTSKKSESWLQELQYFNFHYAIRQVNDYESHKPFLKGFTAAYCGANILIQQNQKEAVSWLGDDYPYLLKKSASEKNILDALAYATDSYGSREWFDGLDRMKSIKQKVSPKAIGVELLEILS